MAHHTESSQLGEDAAYFLSNTLEDLAARLEAHSRVEQFSVFLRESNGKAVA